MSQRHTADQKRAGIRHNKLVPMSLLTAAFIAAALDFHRNPFGTLLLVFFIYAALRDIHERPEPPDCMPLYGGAAGVAALSVVLWYGANSSPIFRSHADSAVAYTLQLLQPGAENLMLAAEKVSTLRDASTIRSMESSDESVD